MEFGFCGEPTKTCEGGQYNKIGGIPYQFNKEIQCLICKKTMSLVTQFQAPLKNCPNRNLYLFVCSEPKCINKSWRIFRVIIPTKKPILRQDNKENETKNKENELKSNISYNISSHNEWDNLSSFDEQPPIDMNEIQSLFQKKNEKSQSIKNKNKIHNKFKSISSIQSNSINEQLSSISLIESESIIKPHYLEFETAKYSHDETSDDDSNSMVDLNDYTYELKLLKEYELENGPVLCTDNTTNLDNEEFEEYDPGFYNTFLRHFQRQLQVEPDQLIRYEWNGKPLYFNEPLIGTDMMCQYCNKKLVFEFQIMPKFLEILFSFIDEHGKPDLSSSCLSNQTKNSTKMSIEKLALLSQSVTDIATVLIFSCSLNCHDEFDNEQILEERLLIQLDQLI